MREALTNDDLVIRPLKADDRQAWSRLWAGYNAFYGRCGPTALPHAVTERTWRRCLDDSQDLVALVAVVGGKLCGLAHFLFHEATISLHPYCYLSDIYTDRSFRNRGVGRALIEEVYRYAQGRGAAKVYWQTRASNGIARALYDAVAEDSGFIVYRKVFR